MNGIYNQVLQMKIIIFIFNTLILVGCEYKNFNRDAYNALLQRECIKKTGEPHCDSNQPSYEEYRREREKNKRQQD